MDNDYINYIQIVCNFDYKPYLDQFFRKINQMSDDTSEVPDIIKNVEDNTVDDSELDEIDTIIKLEI